MVKGQLLKVICHKYMDTRLKIVIILSVVSLILLAAAWSVSNRLAILFPKTNEVYASTQAGL